MINHKKEIFRLRYIISRYENLITLLEQRNKPIPQIFKKRLNFYQKKLKDTANIPLKNMPLEYLEKPYQIPQTSPFLHFIKK